MGKSSSKRLRELKINTIGDLANANYDLLYRYFKNQTSRLINSARGIDDSIVNVKRKEREGISHSVTTSYNLNSLDEIYKVLYPLTERVCMSLRKKQKYSYQVSVTLKDKFFKVYSHQRRLKNPTNNTDEIFIIAKELVKELWNEEGIRLVGISLSKFTDKINHQISMFDDTKDIQNNNNLDKTLDILKNKYGNNIIGKASQL